MGDKVLLTLASTIAIMVAFIDFLYGWRWRQEREVYWVHTLVLAILAVCMLTYLAETRGLP